MGCDDIEHENFENFPISASFGCFNEHDLQFEETEVQIVEFEYAQYKIYNPIYLGTCLF